MWPDFLVVSTPILHFLPCVVKAQEPMRVQAFVSELAIESMKLLNGRIHDAMLTIIHTFRRRSPQRTY